MSTIIKKGTNASAFRVNNKVIVLKPNIMTYISDEDMRELKRLWWGFIEPRIISEKNPLGCFIVSERSESYIRDMSKEIGDIKDNSRIKTEEETKEEVKKEIKKKSRKKKC